MSNYGYVPLMNEPSVFTEKTNRVNINWVLFVKKIAIGVGGLDPNERLDNMKNAFKDSQAKVPSAKTVDSIANVFFVTKGLSLIQFIRSQIEKGVTEDGFAQPTSILTDQGKISGRWVLHVAREDKMSPEEAYAYAQTLLMRK